MKKRSTAKDMKARKFHLGIIGRNPYQDWTALLILGIVLIVLTSVIFVFQRDSYFAIIDRPIEGANFEKAFDIKQAEDLILEFENKRGL